jgi:two-component system sensor histidine kinase CreC
VLFDSQHFAVGADYSQWRDVKRTLDGVYGARTTNDVADDPQTAVMYVGAPIWYQDQIVGVVSVGRPVVSFGQYVEGARARIITAGVVSGVTFLLLAVLVSVWAVRPVGRVASYVRYLRREPGAARPRLGRGLVSAIATAYQEMSDALAGRQYVTEYVQTLTHEIKSPLSAIRGAAELLQEPMLDTDRQRFVENILREAARTEQLVDRLLELAALERKRRLDDVKPVDLRAVAEAAVRATEPRAQRREVSVRLHADDEASLEGDALLLASALTNLLENAIDFSPQGSTVEVRIVRSDDAVEVSVSDRGPGIPDYARNRVFDRFYSLARPHSGKRSTGLGLAFVNEIAELHGGTATLENGPRGGAVATLQLPLQP